MRHIAPSKRSLPAYLPLLLAALNGCSGGEDDAASGADGSPSLGAEDDGADFSCEAPDVLHTGIDRDAFRSGTFYNGAFYVASSTGLLRMPLTGGTETVASFDGWFVRTGATQLVVVTSTGALTLLDYSGQVLLTGQVPDTNWDGSYLDEANHRLILAYLSDAPRFDSIDLTTGTVTSTDFVVGDSGWVEARAGVYSWFAMTNGSAVFAAPILDAGLGFRLDLTTNLITPLAPDLAPYELWAVTADAVYLGTAPIPDAPVDVDRIDTYRISAATEERAVVSAMHGQRPRLPEFYVGFDGLVYFRNLGPTFRIDGVESTEVGFVESECQRDEFGTVDGATYAFLHMSSEIPTETVIVPVD